MRRHAAPGGRVVPSGAEAPSVLGRIDRLQVFSALSRVQKEVGYALIRGGAGYGVYVIVTCIRHGLDFALKAIAKGPRDAQGVWGVLLSLVHAFRHRWSKLLIDILSSLMDPGAAAFAVWAGTFGLVYQVSRRVCGLGPSLSGGCAGTTVALLTIPRSPAGVDPVELGLQVFVRACSVVVRRSMRAGAVPAWRGVAALVFWGCCTELMYDWFYAPWALPPSFERFISRMADMDLRLRQLLADLQSGKVKYGVPDTSLAVFSIDHGLAPEEADAGRGFFSCTLVHPPDGNGALPLALRAHLGQLTGWSPVTGWPTSECGGIGCCDSVDPDLQPLLRGLGKIGCWTNAARRGMRGFLQAMAFFGPAAGGFWIVARLRAISRLVVEGDVKGATWLVMSGLARAMTGAARDASFIGLFVALVWRGVCAVRNARTTDTTISPLVGSALCGLAILVQPSQRWNDLAVYITPRAISSASTRLGAAAHLPPLSTLQRALLAALLSASAFSILMPSFEHDVTLRRILWHQEHESTPFVSPITATTEASVEGGEEERLIPRPPTPRPTTEHPQPRPPALSDATRLSISQAITVAADSSAPTRTRSKSIDPKRERILKPYEVAALGLLIS